MKHFLNAVFNAGNAQLKMLIQTMVVGCVNVKLLFM